MVLFPLVSAECTVPESQLLCVSVSIKEFGHQVKSVFKHKFTSEEVRALQEGGNQVNKLASVDSSASCLLVLLVFCFS